LQTTRRLGRLVERGLAHQDRIVVARGRQPRAVRAERDAGDVAAVAGERPGKLRQTPDDDRMIDTACREALPVRAEREAPDPIGLRGERIADALATERVPDDDGVIDAARGEALAVRGKR